MISEGVPVLQVLADLLKKNVGFVQLLCPQLWTFVASFEYTQKKKSLLTYYYLLPRFPSATYMLHVGIATDEFI